MKRYKTQENAISSNTRSNTRVLECTLESWSSRIRSPDAPIAARRQVERGT